MKWIILYLLTLCFPTTRANCNSQHVTDECIKQDLAKWTRCYEAKIVTCKPRSRMLSGFAHREVNPAEQAELGPTSNHEVRIPSSVLQRIRRTQSEENILVVASVINSALFQQAIPQSTGWRIKPQDFIGGLVLFVKAGKQPVSELTESVQLIFPHKNKMENNGTCVFWKEDKTEWSTEGCKTSQTEDDFICSCRRLGFFAVLVDVIKPRMTAKGHQGEQLGAQETALEGASETSQNQDQSLTDLHAVNFSCITYSGSGLSAFFAFISLFIFLDLH